MLAIEEILSQAAQRLNSAHVHGSELLSHGDRTHYGEEVQEPTGSARSGAVSRRRAISRSGVMRLPASTRAAHVKRGLAITPVKFGIPFTAAFYNQAGAPARVSRRHRAGESRRHRNGAGPAHEDAAGGCRLMGVGLAQVRLMSTRNDGPEYIRHRGHQERPERRGSG
jgi:xanthine dehydrogenase large subunit